MLARSRTAWRRTSELCARSSLGHPCRSREVRFNTDDAETARKRQTFLVGCVVRQTQSPGRKKPKELSVLFRFIRVIRVKGLAVGLAVALLSPATRLLQAQVAPNENWRTIRTEHF